MKRFLILSVIFLTACSSPQPAPASLFDGSPVPPTFEFGSTPEGSTPTPYVPPALTQPINPGSVPEAGELYFFLQPRTGGGTINLVKVSAACVNDPLHCPPMQRIEVPFAFNFTINALAWSRDGKYAAFSYSNNSTGTPTQLWLFDANASMWKVLAEFPYIDPPFWSPDGSWIAFRTQDGLGGEDVYIIRPDGTELKRISANLPTGGRPYIMDGWYTENIIMRSALPGTNGNIFLVRAANGQARPMFETSLTKAQFIASPDAGFFVYDEYDYNSQDHFVNVMEPDGANAVTIAHLKGGSIYPMIWSPDSRLIAFNYYGNMTSGNPTAEVYLVPRAGGELKSVYKGNTVGRLLFSPNGRYLVVEETTSASGGHLYLVDIATSVIGILQAPGLSTDYDWYAPSWRP
ncbi:MAG: PD40 domain-containing protein [Chloroflexi bacterium]|nr:PD40 domain-containing protein [Chloroflexota bacterium]